MKRFLTLIACALPASSPAAAAADDSRQIPQGARMSWLDNGVVKLGADLNRGGAIVFLARAGGENIVNNFDLGRQVQLSFFSGPVPFSVEGQRPAPQWEHIGWNPIQAGDDFKNPSRLLAHENDGRTLHVKCQPMQWPLRNVPGDCTFDSWLELDGAAVKARARLNNARADRTQHPARLQELPAVYANAAFHRVVSYQGNRPFTGEAAAEAPKPAGRHPWAFWQGTEGWAALLDARDHGIGLITPGRVHFTGGFAGTPGANDTFANSTGYLAGQAQEILDHDIAYEFTYELVVGGLAEIRARAATFRRTGLPSWTFDRDRQGWHYQNADDTGWPIAGQLHVRLEKEDPQLISPHTFWQAGDAPYVIIEAAFQSEHRAAQLYWQPYTTDAPGKDDTLPFPIEPDGAFHRYVIHLAASPAYRGPMIRLRLDPSPAGKVGSWVKVRSIRLAKEQ
jgi:hypothetical protein